MTAAADAHTFFFADLAGFTALTEAMGDSGAADLAQEFYARAATLINTHGGEQVKVARCFFNDAMSVRMSG